VTIVTILLAITASALLAALVLVRARERRAAALAQEERRLRLELEAKTAELDRATGEMKANHLRLLQAEKVASLSGLVAGITHELNNPLAVISGFAELLLARDQDPMAREALEAIHGEAKRCSRIVQNLLSFSRQRRMTKAPVDLNEIVEHVLELLRYKFSLDDIRPAVRLDKRLPAALGDLTQIQQIVLHLVLNAHRAVLELPAGAPRRIEIETRAEEKEVVLVVADGGKGIAEKDAPRIFDPFFNWGGDGREGGLGLAVCYGLVKEHGGAISLDSTVGKGSRFTVRLPVAQVAPGLGAPAEPPAAEKPRPEARALADSGEVLAATTPSQVGVLVADDEEPIVRLLTQVLTREGYRCGAAHDGEEALRLLRSGAFDVAIVDLLMPRLSGIELHRRLVAEAPALAARLIFTTGDAAGAETAAFLEQVRNRRVRKPFEIQEVTRAVADIVREHAGTRS
jgi:two-component system NtrC family sensor kinase